MNNIRKLIFIILLTMLIQIGTCLELLFGQNPIIENTTEDVEEFWNERLWPDYDVSKATEAGNQFQSQTSEGNVTINCPTIPTWNALGPYGPFGFPNQIPDGHGRSTFIRFHPQYDGMTNKTIFCGGAAGGLWKSDDDGLSWRPLNTDKSLFWLNVSDLAINPYNSNEMFLGTGHFQGGFQLSGGLYRTTDGGNSWNSVQIDLGNSRNLNFLSRQLVGRIVYHPTVRDFMMMTVYDMANHTGGRGWILKSTTGGDTWQVKKEFIGVDNSNDILTTNCVYDLEFHPTNPNIIYTMGHYFWRSLDGGETFERIVLSGDERYGNGQGLINIKDLPSLVNSRLAISKAVGAQDRVYIFRINQNNPFYFDVYVSVNKGNNFFYKEIHANGGDGLEVGGYTAVHIGLGVDNQTGTNLYLGSANFGKVIYDPLTSSLTFSGIIGGYSTRYCHPDLKDVVPDPLNLNKIWFATDGGIHTYLRDNGTWTFQSNGLCFSQFYRLGTSCTSDLRISAGAVDNGSVYFQNGNWRKIGYGDGTEGAIACDNPDFIYSSTQNGGVQYTTLSNNLTQSLSGNGDWISPYIFDPDNPKMMYFGFEKVYFSSERGINRSPIVNGIFQNNYVVKCLALGKQSTNAYIYYTLKKVGNDDDNDNHNFYFWYNNGNNVGSNPLPSIRMVTSITVDPVDPLKLWITFSGYDDGKKVYYSTDGGGTWSNVTANLPNLPCNTIIIDKTSPFKTIYVGMDVGVYYRHFGIVNSEWQCFTGSLPNTVVNELDIHYPTRQLVAATFGRGIWATGLACFPYPENLYSHNASPNRLGTQVVQNRIIGARINQGQPADLTFSVGETAEYVAGDMIEFMPGFEAVAGSNLIARIDAALECSTSPVISPRIESPYTIGSNFKKTNTGDVNFSAYPNPTTGEVWLKADNNSNTTASVELTDLMGKTVFPLNTVTFQDGLSTAPLTLNGLSSGVYLLKISTSEKTTISKLVIQKD